MEHGVDARHPELHFSKDPIYRRHHHGDILFGLHYAFSENFILPLSHDEVVHGKRSILGRMPGDDWQRFANLRAYYGFMFGHPGKKLMFMGSSSARTRMESRRRLPWHLLEQPAARRRAARWCATSTGSTATTPALHELDCDAAGFEWLVADDAATRTVRLAAQGQGGARALRGGGQFHAGGLRDYRVRVPFAGTWREVLNTDAAHLWGQQCRERGACPQL